MVHLSWLCGNQSDPSRTKPKSNKIYYFPPFSASFFMPGSFPIPESQKMVLTSAKSRNFRPPAMQSFSLDKSSCFTAREVDPKMGNLLLNRIFLSRLTDQA